MKKILPYLLILTFAFFGLKSLIESPFYSSHDGFTHTARIAAYNKILNDKQFPPRWAVDLNGTLGSPIFVYSYPLPYFIGSLINRIGLSYQDSFRSIMAFSYIAGSLGMFLWLKNKYGVPAGTTGAIFYMFVPYRFLNLYVRGAFAESLAYAVLPFIFWTIDKNKFAGTALFIALLLLSHNVVSAIFLPILFIYILINYWKKWTTVTKLMAGLVLGLLVSSFIYLPDLFERHFVRFDQGISYYKEHFVAAFQLFRSPWGYGFDLPGTINDEMSFQLGLANLLVLALLSILLLIQRRLKIEILFLIILLVVTTLLMVETPHSVILWKSIPMLATIVDFPWRLLGVTAFVFAVLSAYLVKISPWKIGICIFLLLAVAISNRNFLRVNEALTYPDELFDNYTGSATANSNEYYPKLHSSPHLPNRVPPVEIKQGNAAIKTLVRNSQSLVFEVKASAPAEVRINRFYFQDTQISKNGILLTPIKDWVANDDKSTDKFDDTGTIHLKISPPGGIYDVKFRETPLRNFANLLSVVAFVSLLLALTLSLKKKR